MWWLVDRCRGQRASGLMRRFKNILIYDTQHVGDEAALTRATKLAKRNEARLTVLTLKPEGLEKPVSRED